MLLALPGVARAQTPPPLPGIIQRVLPPQPPELGPPLLPPETGPITGPGAGRLILPARVTIAGNTALAEAALRVRFAALENRQVTLAEVEQARLAILGAYREAGFPYVAVRATLAALAEGGIELRFLVIEGVIAEITLEGDIGPAERQARRFLDPLLGQRPLPAAALERALLLAGDIAGVTARGVLRPIPEEPGALQLVVQLARQPFDGFFNLDNRGYDLTGAWQGLLVAHLNAFTGLGERTEIAAFETDGHGQTFLQVTEEFFLGGSGLRLRAYAGGGRAAPGSALAAIGYAGETRVGGAALLYPVIRSRPLNLNVSGHLDAYESTVEFRSAPGESRSRQSRDGVRALRLGADGAFQDAWLGFAPAAAASTGLVRFSQGLSWLGASDGDSGLTARLGSDFGFSKVVGEASRLQPLFSPAEGWLVSLFGVVAGQWSDDVLPPAEKFYLGGNRLGRGFYAGQVTGDRALAGSLELQLSTVLELPRLRLGTQFYAFRDEGSAWDNGPFALDRSVGSWGGGVRLQFDERVQLDIEGVRRITRQPDGANTQALSADAAYVRLLVRF
ncbi:ShlB/FhaC/HecB family hemolysin secretion/activation protein [Roseomonas sp. AR75]|uniref:ShlB/FhaC/HecB family hemolysin secretion/activation protein n=1 Tax=Roseomonas sp. AR75 TaxID=2562311 RepID=UPI0010C0532E|nr:ShlB/FhaC/HecB family hemolysin secretion/activation protein [Roseomonas sp. AR75]